MHLSKLAKAVTAVLKQAMSLGRTYIITNAAEGWVQTSCQIFLSEAWETVQRIPVISARTNYEAQLPGCISEWKIHAFLET